MPDANESYADLVRFIRAGGRVLPCDLRAILAESGKSAEALLLDAHGASSGGTGAAPGDKCPCGACIVVRSSKRRGTCQVQRLKCPACGRDHGRHVAPAAVIRRRQRRGVVTPLAPLGN
jgi:hypothetical protein